MKPYIYLMASVAFIASCNAPKEKVDNRAANMAKLNQLEWLSGNWVRTNDEDGNSITYEHWKRASDSVFVGKGFTVQIDESIFEPDTVFNEGLRILIQNDTLIYEVTGVNEEPTLFKFIEQTDTSFVSVNPINDFPKKIVYTYYNRHITATISGKGPDISFIFRRE